MLTERTEIAYAPSAIDVRPVSSGNFGYAKIIGLPFFGAGVVELPPSGFKRAKNSRRMQMAFYVASGGVQVTVGDSTFTIHKGGVWQVPRGQCSLLSHLDFFFFSRLSQFSPCISIFPCLVLHRTWSDPNVPCQWRGREGFDDRNPSWAAQSR